MQTFFSDGRVNVKIRDIFLQESSVVNIKLAVDDVSAFGGFIISVYTGKYLLNLGDVSDSNLTVFVAIAQGVAVAHLKIKGVGVVVVIRFRNRMIFVDLIGDFIIAGRQLCKLAENTLYNANFFF